MQFVGCQIETNDQSEREQVIRELSAASPAPILILNTCQRLECYGFGIPEDPRIRVMEIFEHKQAFSRIARIAAGLESRILGELEILGQVRNAYKAFRKFRGHDDKILDRVFQDAIALGRDARRRSGIDTNMTSLSGLAARELMSRIDADSPVAVIGAGSLAGSVARYLRKRGSFPVRIASRCPENAMSLALEIGGFSAALDDLIPIMKDVAGVIAATAAPHPVLYPHHLEQAARPLTIIDLGVPADCHIDIRTLPGVDYIGLHQIEEKAQINTEDRRRRALIAEKVVQDGVEAWASRR